MTTPKNIMMIIKIKYHEWVVYELTVDRNKTFRVQQILGKSFDLLTLFYKVHALKKTVHSLNADAFKLVRHIYQEFSC